MEEREKVSAEALRRAREYMGRVGGFARARKLSKRELSEQAQKATRARWAKSTKRERSEAGRKAAQARWAKTKRRKAGAK